jgi:glycosyltransferase involved in cell wall biosynthesis
MTVLFLTSEPFPIGMASTNRILALARGLVEAGARVKVICFRTVELPGTEIRNAHAIGSLNGVDYEYGTGTTIRGATFLLRRWLVFRSFVRTIGILIEEKRKGCGVVLLQYLNEPKFQFLFFLVTRILGVIYARDQVEYPFVYHTRSKAGGVYANTVARLGFKYYDGIFAITRALEEYVRTRKRKRSALIRVPMTVETGRFTGDVPAFLNPPEYVAYCGYIHGDKDGIPILIRAFGKLAGDYPGLLLYIIGDGVGPEDFEILYAVARESGVFDRVVFTGRVARDEMPKYLCNARVLALARPTGLQAEGGFPSKLGEYLATARPVVVTSVGEIPEYIQDGETAFLAPPDSVDAFAERLRFVLDQRAMADTVARRGRAFAIATFDYRIQGGRMLEFFQGLSSSDNDQAHKAA